MTLKDKLTIPFKIAVDNAKIKLQEAPWRLISCELVGERRVDEVVNYDSRYPIGQNGTTCPSYSESLRQWRSLAHHVPQEELRAMVDAYLQRKF